MGEWMPGKHEAARECSEKDEKDTDFSKARQLLVDLLGLPDLQRVFDDEERGNAKRVYTQAPTLLLLILQRLGGGLSLSALVQELLTHHRDLLSVNHHVQQDTLSDKNSACNKARQRLPLRVVEAFVDAVCNHLGQHSEPVWEGVWTAPRSHCSPLRN